MTLTTAENTATTTPALSLLQLHLMRGGYLLMGLGLALVKWPLLPEAHAQPVYEGVVTCLLSAVGVLALLGLRHPVKLLPLLLLEVTAAGGAPFLLGVEHPPHTMASERAGATQLSCGQARLMVPPPIGRGLAKATETPGASTRGPPRSTALFERGG